MPTIPRYTKCAHLGCQDERSRYNSYCLDHGGKDTLVVSKQRAENNSMYQQPFWKTLRKQQLSMHPLCAGCQDRGVIAQATVVDHVFPWAHINAHAFTNNLFQSLCASCHGDKSYLEQRGVIKWYGHNDYVLEDYQRIVNSGQK